jgi:exonuclease SbcD
MGAKGEISISLLPLTPLHEMREIRGLYNDVMKRENYTGTNTDDYVHIILTDEHDEPDAMAKLRNVYPNLMRLEYDNTRTRAASILEAAINTEKKSPLELFDELFEMQNGQPMNEEQSKYTRDLFYEIWEGAVKSWDR